MNWIILTLLMFLSSVILYVFVRIGKNLKMSAGLLNLASFAVPTICLYIYLIGGWETIDISFKQFLIILFSAFFFSFLGNYFSMKGQQEAANPGFSLMIQKSYGAFTIFLAAILFDSSITLIKLIGTFVIIVFGLVLSMEKGKKLFTRDNMWLLYSMLSFFMFGMLSIAAKYLFNEDLTVFEFMIVLYTLVTLFGLLQQVSDRKSIKFSKGNILIFVLIGVFSLLFNLFKNQAYQVAPNIGYVNAANAGSIAALTVVAALLFGDRLSLRKVIGVSGIFAGLVMIFV
ncbi:hypothetical protein GF389_03900 [Candidatus Dojkabacteria bacterium]|nr:hypothetical protein [Candidatus Dojkabacteria bacterium]